MDKPNSDERVMNETDIRLHGLEFAMEESVPQLLGAVVLHLARKGLINLAELEADLRGECHPDPRVEDSTGAMYVALAGLVARYRDEGSSIQYPGMRSGEQG